VLVTFEPKQTAAERVGDEFALARIKAEALIGNRL
jgi:hypothetical protein